MCVCLALYLTSLRVKYDVSLADNAIDRVADIIMYNVCVCICMTNLCSSLLLFMHNVPLETGILIILSSYVLLT